MRSRISLHAVLVVMALVAAAIVVGLARSGPSVAPPPRLGVTEAVRRTLAAGSAHVHARVQGRSGQPPVEVDGVTSLRTLEGAVVATGPDGSTTEVRTTAAGAWVRVEQTWLPVDPDALALAGGTRGWGDLLRRLQPTRSPGRATLDGRPVTLALDEQGRIRRLLVETASGHLDVRFSDHGRPVHVESPGP